VKHGTLPISLSIPLLAKLAAIRSTGVQIVLRVQESNHTSTVIFTDSQLRKFVGLSVSFLNPIIKSLGSSIAAGFSDSEAVKEYALDVSTSLNVASDEAFEQEFDDETFLTPRINFIKPFREDIDNRNDYKNQVKIA